MKGKKFCLVFVLLLFVVVTVVDADAFVLVEYACKIDTDGYKNDVIAFTSIKDKLPKEATQLGVSARDTRRIKDASMVVAGKNKRLYIGWLQTINGKLFIRMLQCDQNGEQKKDILKKAVAPNSRALQITYFDDAIHCIWIEYPTVAEAFKTKKLPVAGTLCVGRLDLITMQWKAKKVLSQIPKEYHDVYKNKYIPEWVHYDQPQIALDNKNRIIYFSWTRLTQAKLPIKNNSGLDGSSYSGGQTARFCDIMVGYINSDWQGTFKCFVPKDSIPFGGNLSTNQMYNNTICLKQSLQMQIDPANDILYFSWIEDYPRKPGEKDDKFILFRANANIDANGGFRDYWQVTRALNLPCTLTPYGGDGLLIGSVRCRYDEKSNGLYYLYSYVRPIEVGGVPYLVFDVYSAFQAPHQLKIDKKNINKISTFKDSEIYMHLKSKYLMKLGYSHWTHPWMLPQLCLGVNTAVEAKVFYAWEELGKSSKAEQCLTKKVGYTQVVKWSPTRMIIQDMAVAFQNAYYLYVNEGPKGSQLHLVWRASELEQYCPPHLDSYMGELPQEEKEEEHGDEEYEYYYHEGEDTLDYPEEGYENRGYDDYYKDNGLSDYPDEEREGEMNGYLDGDAGFYEDDNMWR